MIDRITVGIDFDGVFNAMAFVIGILVKVLIFTLSVDTLTIKIDKIDSILDQQREVPCDYGNNGNATIIVNNLHSNRVTAMDVGFFVVVCRFTMQVMNQLIMTVLIEVESIFVVNAESTSKLAIQSLIGGLL